MDTITRRSFLASAAAIGAFRNLPALGGTDASPADAIVLENDRLRAVFDRKYGSLLSFENKQTGWHIEDRPQYGAAFRMQVPLPDRHYNFITEKEVPPPKLIRGVEHMADLVLGQMKAVLDAYARRDISKAMAVWRRSGTAAPSSWSTTRTGRTRAI